MGLPIFLAIVAALIWLVFAKTDIMLKKFLPPDEQQIFKQRNPEQKQIMRYFVLGGCAGSGAMSDMEYDNLLKNRIDSLNLKQRAINKIGLDDSELTEIEPVRFENYFFSGGKTFTSYGKDGKTRSSAYQVTWVFANAKQVYLFQYTLHMDKDVQKEHIQEYFWKDITNFSSTNETVETLKPTVSYFPPKVTMTKMNVSTNCFALIVPGDKVECSMEANDFTERSIKGMKTKLREKKDM